MIKTPKGNKTGPWGQGPRTGRELGYCSGYPTPGYTKGSGMDWGHGFRGGRGGRGWGRGWRYLRGRNFYLLDQPISPFPLSTQINPEDEAKYLEDSLNGLKKEIELIEKRLEELTVKKDD